MSYDCLVLGAGPAGSTAARELAARGARVLLVDRAPFPRDKPCGGGVLISAAAQLPFPLDPVVEQVVTGFAVTYKRGRRTLHRHDAPLVYMTQRCRLDAFLVDQAVAAGALFQDGRLVTSVEPDSTAVTLRFRGGDVVTASCVVAADGANSVARRALGLPPLRSAVALEANAPGVPDRWRDRVALDLGSLPGGYGWIFPKGDHCNLGVGGWPTAGPHLRRHLARYAASEGFDPHSLVGLRGHALPLRDLGAPLVQGPIAFVGDAAGLVDPLSGEGIGNAFRSGRLAAVEIARLLAGAVSDLSGYQRAVQRAIDPDLAVSSQLQALFHQQPWPYVRLLQRSRRFGRTFCRIVRGESSYARLKERLGPFGLLVDAAAWQAERSLAARTGWTGSGKRA